MSGKIIGTFLSILVAGGCTVHHHHHHPPVAETPTHFPAIEDDERWDSPEVHPDESSNTSAEYHTSEPVRETDADVESPKLEDRRLPDTLHIPPRNPPPDWQPVSFVPAVGPLTNCSVLSYETGWVVAHCADAKIILQTGAASRGAYHYLFSYAGDLASTMTERPSLYRGDRGKVKLGGLSLETTEFEMQAMKESAFGGWTADSSGAITARGIYTIAKTKRGKTGMLCMQEGRFDRDRCVDYFKKLSTSPLSDIGMNETNQITLAGVTLKSEGRCYFLRPQELGCPSGGLLWSRGSSDAVENLVQTTLVKWTDTHGVKGFHNPHLKRSCRINGEDTTCHEVRFQGVLDTPVEIRHIAEIRDETNTLGLICTYSTSDPAPQPCRQYFPI